MRSIILFLVLSVGILELAETSFAQQISMDRGVRTEGLWCFPLVTDSTQYLYLPDQSMLGTNEKKEPQFSFVQYVKPGIQSGSNPDHSIVEADGGAVLHFLVTYDTDERKVARAQERLRELMNDDEITLRGPVIFKEGRYALVSSIINNEGKPERMLMAMGAAPVLQGSKIAFSFELDAQRSTLLLESFKTTTPDVSIVFDLAFGGLADAYNAKMTVDWNEVQKYEKISGGANVYFVSAELESIYEELRRSSAIKLETAGEDDRMQAIVDEAFKKVTDMMFQRIEPEQAALETKGGLMDLLGGLFGSGGNGIFSSGNTFNFGAHFGYKLKNIKLSGTSVLDFNSRNYTERHHYITFNIGDLYKKYGENDKFFRTVSLYNPDFEVRQIYVGVDGALLPEFDKMINSVTVTLRKEHQNGSTTLKEVTIKKETVNEGRELLVTYNSVGDADREKWLDYNYRIQYNFVGGKTYQTDWNTQNNSMINLFVPYTRKSVQLDADNDLLVEKNVRAITVKIDYPFLGENRSEEMTVRPGDDLSKKSFEITLPAGRYDYNYSIKWRFKDNTEKTFNGNNDNELLFIDNIPEE